MSPVQHHMPLGGAAHADHSVAQAGRLAAPVYDWPLSIERFDALCEGWRQAGLTLSIWNAQRQVVIVDSQAPSTWRMLMDRARHFQATVEGRIGAMLSAGGRSVVPDEEPIQGSSGVSEWDPDLVFVTIPVKRGRRIIGVVAGFGVAAPEGGEALRRICDRDQLDWQTIRATTRDVPLVTLASERISAVFATTVDMARQADEARSEVHSLSGNLESTYEELNLIYRVSNHLGLPQRPIDLLSSVGRELVDVSRSAAVAFILPPTPSSRQPNGAGPVDLKDRIVQVGKAAPNLEALERLSNCVKLPDAVGAGHVLLNEVAEYPELAWAAPWLKHAIALPLATSDRQFGLQLAMNCRDEGDYTSIDVQLHRAVADRITAFLENQRLYDDLADLLMGLLHAMVSSIDAKDPYTSGHSERVAHFSRMLAEALGFTPVMCQRVYLSGLLHDIGKIGVPDAILCKPGKLTDDEFAILKRHPEIGGRILTRIRQLNDLMPGVLYHHERFDGRGYPAGRSGSDIPRLGRIICLADCFDAMTTNRTYRAAMPIEQAISEIRRCAGTQFDPHMAEQFLGLGLHDAYADAHANAYKRPELSQIGALCHSDDHLLSPDWNGVL